MSRRIVIGVGRRDHGDDAAGLLVADALRDAPGVEALALEGVPPELYERWDASARVVLVDAACGGGRPGTIHRFDALAGPLPVGTLRLSTHGLGLGEAIELARALGALPARLSVFGVEASAAAPGTPPGPAVAAALPTLAALVQAALEEVSCTSEP